MTYIYRVRYIILNLLQTFQKASLTVCSNVFFILHITLKKIVNFQKYYVTRISQSLVSHHQNQKGYFFTTKLLFENCYFIIPLSISYSKYMGALVSFSLKIYNSISHECHRQKITLCKT